MSRTLVLTVNVGAYRRLGRRTVPVMQSYARRCGAEFLEIRTPMTRRECARRGLAVKLDRWFWLHLGRYPSKLTKFRMLDLFDTYERILYLDCTAVIHPECPSLFDLVPADAIGATREQPRPGLLEEVYAYYGVEPIDDVYVNSGVLVLSRRHRSLFQPPPVALRNFRGWFSQPYENAMRHRHGYRVHELDGAFNLTGRKIRDFEANGTPEHDPRRASIVHVTGGYSPYSLRRRGQLIEALVRHWYLHPPPVFAA